MNNILSQKKVLVFGKSGQVATALYQALPSAVFVSSSDCDFTQKSAIRTILQTVSPEIVINAAAYTLVDAAESEQEKAFQINAEAPGEIASWCMQNNSTFIHYSTDYVFDGSGEKPWLENDLPAPINVYGSSKWEGEKAIQRTGCASYIFRVSWVYSDWGSNFKKTILRLAQEREELRVVNDQWGSPTHAIDIARQTLAVAERINSAQQWPLGLHHLRFNPYMTWFHFAQEIVKEAHDNGLLLKLKSLLPIQSSEYPTKAKRPLNSRLDTLYPNLTGRIFNSSSRNIAP